MTTRLDSSGARAGPRKRRCACRTPASTMPTPYSTTCGMKTTSIRLPVCTAPSQVGSSESSARTSAGAASAPSSATGTSSATVQVSSALAVADTVARSPSRTAPARTGTTSAASAPPATTSKTTFGTALAAE